MVEIILPPVLHFSTRENCINYFSNLLADYKSGDLIEGRDADELRALVHHHYDAERLIGSGISYFQKAHISRMSQFGAFVIARTDETAVAFSHRIAAVGYDYEPRERKKNKGFLERPIGLAASLTWIPHSILIDA
jgi:hypothetical protein